MAGLYHGEQGKSERASLRQREPEERGVVPNGGSSLVLLPKAPSKEEGFSLSFHLTLGREG